ncbi:MAG: hypothetical protein Q9182_005287 [Xanthomendoza sp. 2 TL-2023]
MAEARLAEVEGRLKTYVAMNSYDHVVFGEDGKDCIATKELNACHAVAIISKQAAILGHWAALAPAKLATMYPTGDEWTSHMINSMLQDFKLLKAKFEHQGPGGIIIYGQYEIHGAKSYLEDHVKIIANGIESTLGKKAKEVPYKVYLDRNEYRPPDKGIVLIDGNTSGQIPIVWLEDRQLSLS